MIKRTITATKVLFKLIKTNENGEVDVTDHEKILSGSVSKEKATKVLNKELKLSNDETFLITSMKEETNRYEISIEDFIKNATLIPKEDQEEQ